MSTYRFVWGLVGIGLLSVSSVAFAADIENKRDGIGFYTAVLGQVSVAHPSEGRALPVKLNDTVLFKDVIQTYTESRTRAFFQDESMLTVGENSRVEINEYIYDPDQNVRRAIVKLMQGQVRALVSKVFKANGSKFEVHTPSAVAAARGTYFTVWTANGQSGIINIGEKGRVDFTSGGTTVAVDPGFFSIAEDGKAPSLPMPHHLGETTTSPSSSSARNPATPISTRAIEGNQGTSYVQTGESAIERVQTVSLVGLADALRAVDLTTLRDSPPVELPVHTLQALSINTNLLRSLTNLASPVLGSSGESSATTTAGTTGTLLNRSVTVGTLSIGTSTTSGGAISTGSLSAGSTTAVVAPLTSTVSTVVAPVTSVVSTVVAPVSPLISTVVAPVAPVLSPVVAPVAPVVSPVIAPVAPLVNPVLATPPAVISGALTLLP
ncbi:MAG: FecR family protein [Nitrospira sp.]|nr:FecR family protein [Nitrospira sp.]